MAIELDFDQRKGVCQILINTVEIPITIKKLHTHQYIIFLKRGRFVDRIHDSTVYSVLKHTNYTTYLLDSTLIGIISWLDFAM